MTKPYQSAVTVYFWFKGLELKRKGGKAGICYFWSDAKVLIAFDLRELSQRKQQVN